MADETAKEKAMGGGYQCGRCKFPIVFSGKNNNALCFTCGTVNGKPEGDPSGDRLPCVLPEGFEWEFPAGVKGPDVPKTRIGGKTYIDYPALVSLPMNAMVIYVDSFNKEWNRMDWIKNKWTDPAITLKKMREHMKPTPIIELGFMG